MKFKGLSTRSANIALITEDYQANDSKKIPKKDRYKNVLCVLICIFLILKLILDRSGEMNLTFAVLVMIAIIACVITDKLSNEYIDEVLEDESLYNNMKIYKVYRGNDLVEIPLSELVCDDVILLTMGDIVPAVCKIISGSVTVNYSKIDGSNDVCHKSESVHTVDSIRDITYDTEGYLVPESIVLKGSCVAKLVYSTELKLTSQENSQDDMELVKDIEKIKTRYKKLGTLFIIIIIFANMYNGIILNDFVFSLKNVGIFVCNILISTMVTFLLINSVISQNLPEMIFTKLISILKLNGVSIKGLTQALKIASVKNIFFTKEALIKSETYEVAELILGNFEQVFAYPKKEQIRKLSDEVVLDIIYGFGLNTSSFSNDGKVVNNNQFEAAITKFAVDCVPYYEDIRDAIVGAIGKHITIGDNKITINDVSYVKGNTEEIIKKCNRIISNNEIVKLTRSRKEALLTGLSNNLLDNSEYISMAKTDPNGNLIFIATLRLSYEIDIKSLDAIKLLKHFGLHPIYVTSLDKRNVFGDKFAELFIKNTRNIVSYRDISSANANFDDIHCIAGVSNIYELSGLDKQSAILIDSNTDMIKQDGVYIASAKCSQVNKASSIAITSNGSVLEFLISYIYSCLISIKTSMCLNYTGFVTSIIVLASALSIALTGNIAYSLLLSVATLIVSNRLTVRSVTTTPENEFISFVSNISDLGEQFLSLRDNDLKKRFKFLNNLLVLLIFIGISYGILFSDKLHKFVGISALSTINMIFVIEVLLLCAIITMLFISTEKGKNNKVLIDAKNVPIMLILEFIIMFILSLSNRAYYLNARTWLMLLSAGMFSLAAIVIMRSIAKVVFWRSSK